MSRALVAVVLVWGYVGTATAQQPLCTPAAGLTRLAGAVYRLAQPAAGRVEKLQLVTRLPLDRVTGAGASPDGNVVAVRTNKELLLYRTQELIGGNAQPRRFDLTVVGEPQGEGVAVAADGLIYLTGEAGGGGGTFAALRCTLR